MELEVLDDEVRSQDELDEADEEEEERLLNEKKILIERYRNIATEALNLGNYDIAFENYSIALKLDFTDPLNLLNQSIILQKLEKYQESLIYSIKSYELDNNLLNGYIITIKTYILLNNIDNALKIYHIIPEIYRFQSDVIEIQSNLSILAKNIGNNNFRDTKYTIALNYYTIAIELDTENYLLYSNRSACYQSLKLYNEAITDANIVIELNNKFFKGYLHIIKSYIQLNKLEEALETIDTAELMLSTETDWNTLKTQFNDLKITIEGLKIKEKQTNQANDRNKAEMFKNKGNALYKSGSYSDAIRQYSQAIAIIPSDGLYYGNRAASWIMLKEYQHAINDCSLGLTYEVNYSDLHKLRIRKIQAMINVGKLDESLVLIKEVLQKAETDSIANDVATLKPFQEQLTLVESIKANLLLGIQSLERNEFRLVFHHFFQCHSFLFLIN